MIWNGSTLVRVGLILPGVLLPGRRGAAADDAAPIADASASVSALVAKYQIPGMAVAVLRGDRLVAQGVAGVRKFGAPEAITIADRFHLGSDTKSMTATLVAFLVEQGRLRWNTTIAEVFGGSVKEIDPEWRAVTVEQLLLHRSGAPAELHADGLWARLWQHRGTTREQRPQLVEGVLRRAPGTRPGTKFIYSNAGYALAGAMAEKVADRSWEEMMQELLFQPLGIASAGFGAPGEVGTIDQPRGHPHPRTSFEPGPGADNPAAIGPAGTVHMSLPDWAKYVALHLRAHAANPRREVRLLAAASFDRLHTAPNGARPEEAYGGGWMITTRPWAKGGRPHDVGTALTHAGSNTLWFCTTWLAPEKDFAVLVASNCGAEAAARACDDAVGVMIREFLQE